jgi:hypothetical protein
MYTFGGFGSDNRTTYFIPTAAGLYVRCGCWAGSIDDFRQRIIDVHGDSEIAAEYLAICDVAEMRRNRAIDKDHERGDVDVA